MATPSSRALLMKIVRYLCRIHDALTDAGYIIGVVGLSSMVLIYCAEVVTRYFLSSALSWANDTFSNVMCVSLFAMIPHATRAGRHIAINLVPELLPAARIPLAYLAAAAGFLVCAFVGWMSLEENIRQIDLGIVTEQNNPVPKIWISAFITYGFFGAALYFLRDLFHVPAMSMVATLPQPQSQTGPAS
jgi:C4-dicarboxylate transporter, DctQ subunit